MEQPVELRGINVDTSCGPQQCEDQLTMSRMVDLVALGNWKCANCFRQSRKRKFFKKMSLCASSKTEIASYHLYPASKRAHIFQLDRQTIFQQPRLRYQMAHVEPAFTNFTHSPSEFWLRNSRYLLTFRMFLLSVASNEPLSELNDLFDFQIK